MYKEHYFKVKEVNIVEPDYERKFIGIIIPYFNDILNEFEDDTFGFVALNGVKNLYPDSYFKGRNLIINDYLTEDKELEETVSKLIKQCKEKYQIQLQLAELYKEYKNKKTILCSEEENLSNEVDNTLVEIQHLQGLLTKNEFIEKLNGSLRGYECYIGGTSIYENSFSNIELIKYYEFENVTEDSYDFLKDYYFEDYLFDFGENHLSDSEDLKKIKNDLLDKVKKDNSQTYHVLEYYNIHYEEHDKRLKFKHKISIDLKNKEYLTNQSLDKAINIVKNIFE